MHVHMHWISYCLATAKLSSWGWGACVCKACTGFAILSEINHSKFAIGKGGGGLFLKAFQNTQLKQTLEAKGPGPFPYLAWHPFCFAQDHASVPLCGVAVLGLHMGYPRGYPWGYHMLEQSMPLCLPLAYPWQPIFKEFLK